ncbi:ladderlectin-like isoform X2 [Hemibagrus wyckioides]|uniref:ladderlectin-like isoform X2 n=1 Tax=Hemibagrus wyckioides TaxID=337641 RepID=UPI00266BF039|nr:ladderlectin-like isoform X2 [Hemibagrus wyckioides]
MKAYLFLLTFIGIVPATLSLLRPVGHKYYVIKTKVTWPVAQNYCRETYADMATVESALDWLRLREEVAREGLTDIAWVGLYNDIDTWRWSINNVPLKHGYVLWGSAQPDNTGGHQACGVTGPLGYWWDYSCGNLYPFICYNAHPVRERQILRLQVKSDLSIFDSDVQSAILELVKQKLTENGMMENTTVTWRVKSNGEIFHKKKTDL